MSLTSVDLSASARAPATHAGSQPRASTDLRRLSWPLGSIGEGLREICAYAGLPVENTEPLVIPEDVARDGGENLVRWVAWAADRIGIEAEAIQTSVPDLDAFLAGGGPAILGYYDAEGPRFLLLLKTTRGLPRLLGPDLRVHPCSIEALHQVLAAPAESPIIRDVEQIVDMAGVPPSRRAQVVSQLLRDRLRTTQIRGLLLLRLPASARFGIQIAKAGILPRIGGLIALSVLVYVLEIVAWTVIGEGALNGRLDVGWLSAFVMIVLTAVPLRSCATWLSSKAAMDLSRLLKSRLLAGGLQAEPDTIRKTGVGHLLASIMDVQAFESLAINGGLGALVAIVELMCSAWLLTLGANGGQQVILLLLWTAVAIGLGARHLRILKAWTDRRSNMTHSLVERMIGHRTVLAQDRAEQRDRREDEGLRNYLVQSRDLDTSVLPLQIIIPAGWMLLGLGGLAPGFIAGTVTPIGLAIAIGGIMFAGRALGGVTSGLVSAASALVAWRQIGPLFAAGGRRATNASFIPLNRKMQRSAAPATTKVLDADNLVFRYAGRSQPVIQNATLALEHGDCVLLQGSSGGGKSTLAALLTGLRKPESGLLLLNGLDRQTLGEAWHDFATKAPQFHENHIMTGSLAFNLLMGRGWPADDQEIRLAREVCEDLGLGDLIARMPSGLHQIVGETGWQLSHGERSRIFLARALLQDAPLTILDESFAALDPQTLQRCIDCVFKRARTLVVVAHP